MARGYRWIDLTGMIRRLIMKGKKETLLIVDDSKFQRAVLKEMLRDTFELIEVTSGEECLEVMEKDNNDIDMVLLDLVMPGIDGFEVLRRRQQMEEFKNIPVIVLTTSDSDRFQTEAFELGADEFIVKPVDSKIALTRINNILYARRRLQNLLREQQKLIIQSQFDSMTNLYNKETIEKKISQTLEGYPEDLHALMAIDIDNFKGVNDIFGHKMGDHIINVVAGVLSAQFEEKDYIGRIGGDEFVVFMRGIESKNDAFAKAKMIIKMIHEKDGLTIPDNISISVGVAFSDEEDTSYSTLFEKADKALYLAKEAGKGRFTEYGVELESSKDAREVLVCTESRSIESVLDYVFNHHFVLNVVATEDELVQCLESPKHTIAAIYADVENFMDNGEKLWQRLKKSDIACKLPVMAICKEGAMEQIKLAAESGIVKDILLAPLSAEAVTRRARALGAAI